MTVHDSSNTHAWRNERVGCSKTLWAAYRLGRIGADTRARAAQRRTVLRAPHARGNVSSRLIVTPCSLQGPFDARDSERGGFPRKPRYERPRRVVVSYRHADSASASTASDDEEHGGVFRTNRYRVVPARDAEIIEDDNSIRVRYPVALIKGAPTFSPGAELAQVEKEEINGYCGRSSASRRSNSIDEIRPEQAGDPTSPRVGCDTPGSEQGAQDRNDLKRNEQIFFNQNGFVTDALSEVDASEELLRTQKEAKSRNQEDRIKNRSLD